MKQLILILSVVAASLFGSCVTEDRGEQFDPTRPGYFMFNHTKNPLLTEINQLSPVFAFAQYYAATNDEERERIHDIYFPKNRITQKGDEWMIISQHSELVIGTGGKNLDDDGAQWSYYYTGYPFNTSNRPTITHTGTAPGQYALHLPESSKREYCTWGDLTLSVSWNHPPTNAASSIEVLLSGSGTSRSVDLKIDFEVIEPLRYSSSEQTFDQGKLSLSTTNKGVTETATAQYGIYNQIKIEYNGYNKTWNTQSWI